MSTKIKKEIPLFEIRIDKGTKFNIQTQSFSLYSKNGGWSTLICRGNRNPFDNCQTYNISYIAGIFNKTMSFDPIIPLLYIHKINMKSQGICDIHTNYYKLLMDLFKKYKIEVKVDSMYTNNTGSTMHLILFNTSELTNLVRTNSLNVDFSYVDKFLNSESKSEYMSTNL